MHCAYGCIANACLILFVRFQHELLCSHNHIEHIPPEIGRLKNLTIFSIASNRLTQLPVEMSGLVALKSLDICKNAMQVLPPELGLLKDIRKLDIAANP